ncbi:MBL fold metallo-hydrolase [Pseudonocardia ailaonensis]|uniref:MBL fold metallo-hydrolase n=1 Tax=Pseudonocardia ailaonensis TaxID=367279 RepID=A0ABN2NAK8_9PSEU
MSWLELGRGVFARRDPDELDLTTGLVLGAERALVIDTDRDLARGAALAAAVREVTALPVTVVLTHGHFDHCFGTTAFLPCPVLAHPGCRAFLERSEQTTRWAPEFPSIAEVDPVVPTTAPGLVDLGGRLVRLLPQAPAHTDHDLAVHVPDADVLFAGDLVENGTPDYEDAHPLTWADAVAGLPRAGTVVPGHGDPLGAAEVVAQQAELAEVAGLARAVAAGEIDRAEADARSPHPGVPWTS